MRQTKPVFDLDQVAFNSEGTNTRGCGKPAATSIPVVFAIASDPVGQGLVESLARPAGNATGLSLEATDVESKRLELLRQVVPRLRYLAIMFDTDYPAAMLENGALQAAAHTVGLEATPYGIRQADNISTAFAAIKGQQTHSTLSMIPSLLRIVGLFHRPALTIRMPTIFEGAISVLVPLHRI